MVRRKRLLHLDVLGIFIIYVCFKICVVGSILTCANLKKNIIIRYKIQRQLWPINTASGYQLDSCEFGSKLIDYYQFLILESRQKTLQSFHSFHLTRNILKIRAQKEEWSVLALCSLCLPCYIWETTYRQYQRGREKIRIIYI